MRNGVLPQTPPPVPARDVDGGAPEPGPVVIDAATFGPRELRHERRRRCTIESASGEIEVVGRVRGHPRCAPQAGSEVLQWLAGPQRVDASRHKGHRACQQAAHRPDPSEPRGQNAARNPKRRVAAGDEAGERATAFRLERGGPQRERVEAVGDDDPGLRVLG